MATNYFLKTPGNGGSDANPGTSAGAAFASPGFAASVATAAGDTVRTFAGTYAISTASSNVSGGVALITGQTKFFADDPTNKPVMQLGVNSATMITVNGGALVENIIVDANGHTSITGFLQGNDFSRSTYGCEAKGCDKGFDAGSNGDFFFYNCYAESCTTGYNTGQAVGSVAKSCTTGFFNTQCTLSLAVGGTTGFGLSLSGNINCVAYGCSGDGFTPTGGFGVRPSSVANCLAYGCGGYGFNFGSVVAGYMIANCGYGNCTSGGVNGTPTQYNVVSIGSNDPFVNSGATITNRATALAGFVNNASSTGGALLKAAGIVPYFDIGIQHQDSGGGASQTSFTF